MLIGLGLSCRISHSIVSYLYVSCSGSITSVGEERANFSHFLLVMWFLFDVFLFLFVLGIDNVILLSHSLARPYNYY